MKFNPKEYLPEATTFTVTIKEGLQARDDVGSTVGESFSFTTRKGNGRLVPPPTREGAVVAEGRSVEIDLSQQALYAYEDGKLVNAFLVSTGLDGFPTPLGDMTITRKKPVTTYQWFYGEGDSRNYSFPGTQWNMNLDNSLYWLHSAYWHNDFGNVRSHGCINISISDAEWLFNFTDIGTPVHIYAS